MSTHDFKKMLLVVGMAFFIGACGGGGGYGGGSSMAPPADNTSTPGIALGVITGFGSVFVNGIEYDTSTANFSIDDHPGTESDLAVGDVVLLRGRVDNNGATGRADSITFNNNVEGPISSIDTGASTFVVLGQLVLVDADTSFDDSIQPRSVDGLSPGDVVEVTGLPGVGGTIHATRVEQKTGPAALEVAGIVSGVTADTFMINALEVSYAGALLEDFPGGRSVQDGDPVEVKGSVIDAAGVLIASTIEYKGAALGGNQGDHVEIEGLVTRFAAAADFDVSGVPVSTSASTLFTGGMSGDLALGIKVEVEGALNAAGVLVASKVDIRRASVVRVEAAIDSVNAAASSLVVLGITVHIDVLTRMEDQTDQRVDPLTIGDLAAGDFVMLRGSESPAGEVLAARLERDDSNDTILQGFVTSVTQPMFTVLGVSIDTSTTQIFRDVDGSVISSETFFARLGSGDLVKAKGAESSATMLVASQVQLEIEN